MPGLLHEARYDLAAGRGLADALCEVFGPHVERIQVAGSVRRQKPDVGDVELLYIPKDDPIGGDPLHRFIQERIADGVFAYRLNVKGSRVYGPLNKLLVHRQTGIPVDVFATDKENWGMALFVRTGPAEWNIRAMESFRELRMRGHAYGGVTLLGPRGHEGSERREVTCPDEETVFRLLGWAWVEPKDRA